MRPTSVTGYVLLVLSGLAMLGAGLDRMYLGDTDQDILGLAHYLRVLELDKSSASGRSDLYPALSDWKDKIDRRDAWFAIGTGCVTLAAGGLLALSGRRKP